MGEKNCCTKEYLKDNKRFADAFNYVMFDGKQVIKPEGLKSIDTTEIAIVNEGKHKKQVVEKNRDLFKDCVIKKDNNKILILAGIEGQSYIDYAMPVRDMLYDAIDYYSQIKMTKKEVRKRKNINDDEFLSGFTIEDKLVPVITLVIYFGTKEWDGPRSIYEMLDTKDKNILKYINDYKLNIIEPRKIDNFDKFKSDLKIVMELLSCGEDKNRFDQCFKSHLEELKTLDDDAAQVINVCANMNVKIENKKGKSDMCKAWEEIKADEREAGRLIGVQEGIRETIIKMLKELSVDKIVSMGFDRDLVIELSGDK